MPEAGGACRDRADSGRGYADDWLRVVGGGSEADGRGSTQPHRTASAESRVRAHPEALHAPFEVGLRARNIARVQGSEVEPVPHEHPG